MLPRDFTVEDGEMTPTLKVKRRVVQKSYEALIDSMYDEKIRLIPNPTKEIPC